MNIPNNIESMDWLVDGIPGQNDGNWVNQNSRQVFINIAKILRGKGLTFNEIEEILSTTITASFREYDSMAANER